MFYTLFNVSGTVWARGFTIFFLFCFCFSSIKHIPINHVEMAVKFWILNTITHKPPLLCNRDRNAVKHHSHGNPPFTLSPLIYCISVYMFKDTTNRKANIFLLAGHRSNFSQCRRVKATPTQTGLCVLVEPQIKLDSLSTHNMKKHHFLWHWLWFSCVDTICFPSCTLKRRVCQAGQSHSCVRHLNC